ncbi:MAG: class I SAM-dependent methyltransferase [Arenibacterium sp.]
MDWAEISKIWIEMSDQIEATHRPVHDALMARSKLRAGEKVIDIGFGTGDTILDIAKAVGETGQVLGLDIAPQMVEHVADRVKGEAGGTVRLVCGDAQLFAFEPGAADVVISKFGLMFFADTGAAFANIIRALRPGGRMIFAAWGAPAANPFFRIPRQAAMRHLGVEPPPPTPDAPGPMRFGDPDPVLEKLRRAGWEADVETVDLHLTPGGTPGKLARSQLKIGPAAFLIAECEADDTAKTAIVDDLTATYDGMVQDEQVRIPAQIHFFAARRPR